MAAATGAGHVTDDTGDFTQARGMHGLVIDIAGDQTLAGTKRVLVPNGCRRRPETRTRAAGGPGRRPARSGWPCRHQP